MSTTFIFGGSGKVARHLTRILAKEEGHTVHSLIRNPAQIEEIKALGAQPVVQSLEDSDVATLTATIRKCSPTAVVFAAGAGGGDPERTKTVDNLGAIKAFDATAAAGVKRFVIVSALDVRDRENKPKPEWYQKSDEERSDKVWGFIGPYMSAKFAADKDLVTGNDRRQLAYTIVRPGGLSQEPGTGKVEAGKVSLGNMISREDVARVVVQCLKNDATEGLAFDVVGGNTPIAEAINKVAEERIDTFNGRF